jgi:hypothetical protein
LRLPPRVVPPARTHAAIALMGLLVDADSFENATGPARPCMAPLSRRLCEEDRAAGRSHWRAAAKTCRWRVSAAPGRWRWSDLRQGSGPLYSTTVAVTLPELSWLLVSQ